MTTINFVRGHNKSEPNWQIGFVGLIALSLVALLLIIVPLLLQSPIVLTNSNTPFTPHNPDDGIFTSITLDGRLEGIGGISSAFYASGDSVSIAGISGGAANGQIVTAACPVSSIPSSWTDVGGGNFLVGSVTGDEGTTSLYYLSNSDQFEVRTPDGQRSTVSAITCDVESVVDYLNGQ